MHRDNTSDVASPWRWNKCTRWTWSLRSVDPYGFPSGTYPRMDVCFQGKSIETWMIIFWGTSEIRKPPGGWTWHCFCMFLYQKQGIDEYLWKCNEIHWWIEMLCLCFVYLRMSLDCWTQVSLIYISDGLFNGYIMDQVSSLGDKWIQQKHMVLSISGAIHLRKHGWSLQKDVNWSSNKSKNIKQISSSWRVTILQVCHWKNPCLVVIVVVVSVVVVAIVFLCFFVAAALALGVGWKK